MLAVFRSRKMGILALLGFSSGLPLYLTSRTLQAWMTVEGVNLTAIGFFSLASLPYSLKFLWAPLLDRFSFPRLGRRKGWLLATQAALTVAIAWMAFQQPAVALRLVAVNAVLIAFFSATQDITIDAYRVDILQPRETGAGAAVSVLGYRVALIVIGSGALILADQISWPAVYLLAAATMLATLAVSIPVPEPASTEEPPQSMRDAVTMPLADYIGRMGTGRGAWVLVFIVLYRLGDSMINNMTTPFLLQSGFTQTDVGAMQGAVGIIATIGGILAGGGILSRIGVYSSLWAFGALQAVSNLAYLALAEAGRNYYLMAGAVIIENFCFGLGSAALLGFLIGLCNPRFSATQYALLSSVLGFSRDVIVAPVGSIAEITGWPLFFLISFLAALPALFLLPTIRNFVKDVPLGIGARESGV